MNLDNIEIRTVRRNDDFDGQRCGIYVPAVIVEHKPTGLIALCGTERSLTKNRDIALAMLEYGLLEIGIKDE